MKFFYLMLLIGFVSIYSEGKYEGILSSTDPRINDLKKKGEFPQEWKLIFRDKDEDYLIFYDIEGAEIYFKYRRDKFDREAVYRIDGLFPGQAYRVRGQLIGFFEAYSTSEKKNYFPAVYRKLKDVQEENKKHPENIPVYKLNSLESTSIDEILK
ncbi:MAG: hypothetical protein H7A24_05855 [Leptospiraceae bacterium]|nr:hypothetical protein [Leptospiraceae bacterium]MCP5511383.1 hypothetical protein [Leptospiraceae bacterium]